MATIIASHIAANVAPAPSQPWPGIRIHAIAIVQPPSIGMAPRFMRAEDSVVAAAARNTRMAATYAKRSSLMGLPTGTVIASAAKQSLPDDGGRHFEPRVARLAAHDGQERLPLFRSCRVLQI